MKWCSNSRGYRNRFPLAMGALIVALMMVTSCFVLVQGNARGEAEENELAATDSNDERPAPPLERIGFDPVIIVPFIPRVYFTLATNEVRGTDELSYMIVFVNSTIYPSISADLNTYADDVERTGMGVKIITVNDASPEQIRSVIISSENDLEGCMLVGDISAAWFEMHEDWGHGDEFTQFPCDLFYMDRNGVWEDIDDNGIYDVHSGDIQPEIWVGRLKTDDMLGDEVQMLHDYFAKNHAYRTGSLTFSNKALTYVDDDWVPWSTDTSDAVDIFFSDNTIVLDKDTTAKADYLGRLDDSYTAVHVLCHGNPGGQHFKVPGGSGSVSEPNGAITGVDDIRLIDDNVLFYDLFICSGARFTSSDYLAGWYVQSGDTLVALGSTKTGSMINEAGFYQNLGDRRIGDAFQIWFDHTMDMDSTSMQWTMGMAIIGDPTIRMVGNHEVEIETIGLPSGTLTDAVIIQDPDGSFHYGDLVDGKFHGFVQHGAHISVKPIFMGGTGFTTLDQDEFTVVEPLNVQIHYLKQHQVHIESHGLDTFNVHTVVGYMDMGVEKTFPLWDGDDFNEYCDDGTLVTVDDTVLVMMGKERYITESTTSWTLSAPIDEDLIYFHQYRLRIDIQTEGIHPLDVDNNVLCKYDYMIHSGVSHLYDINDLDVWANAGSTVHIDKNSIGSQLMTRRWTCPEPDVITMNGPINIVRLYYEQCWMEISSTGLTLDEYKGGTIYCKFDAVKNGDYWDGEHWADWCNVNSPLLWSINVEREPCWRFHTSLPKDMLVTVPVSLTLAYHEEYKITIAAEGLPADQGTDVVIGTVDLQDIDIDNYVLTLSSANTFSWTGWVDVWTEMTATSLVMINPSEKYLLVCWTIKDTTWAPPTVNAVGPCHTYTAHYMGIVKDMSKDAAGLTESVKVNLQVSLTSAIDPIDLVTLVDDLPNEFSFVVGSAKDNGVKVTPTLTNIMVAPYHQRLTFALGPGSHDIWFEVRVNRAYASDRTVTNTASATFDLKELDPMTLGVEDKMVIHPYVGPTFSVVKTGPDTVKWRTNVSWEFTFIVKDNYAYKMRSVTAKDCFGPEIKYIPSSVMANLVTKPTFSISGYMTKQVGMGWNVGDVSTGEAFMLQVTVYTTDKGIFGGQGFTSLGDNPVDFGASLRFINCNYNQVTLTALPIWVKAIKPL